MAKKHVAVSLRKPPSPEKLDAFVSSGAAEPAAAPDNAPGAPPESGTRETVSADAPEVTPAAPGVAPPPAPPPPLVDAAGQPLHAVTIYLPQALAERLTLHCIERDRDTSNVIGEALEQHLQKRLGTAYRRGSAAAGDGTWSQPAGERGAPPPGASPGPFTWDDPFRWAAGFRQGSRVERILHFGQALWGLWQRRPWAA